MPRAPRLEFPGAIYHVINRGNFRKDLFTVHRTAEAFERALFETCARYGWRLHAHVVMSNHFHLCVETPRSNLVSGMQWLQSVFAHRFNRFQKSPGHVFQGRYKALLVEPGASLLRVVNYIHLNPVRAGLVTVKGLRQYRKGSFPRWFERGHPTGLTAERWLAEAGGLKPTLAGFQRYHGLLELAEEGDPRKRTELHRQLCRGWHIGTKEAKQARLRALLAKPGRTTTTAAKLDDQELATLLLADSLRKLGQRANELASTPKSAPWKVALGWWLRRQTGISNRWLGEHLNLGHPCAVSRLLHQPFNPSPLHPFTPDLRQLTHVLMSTRKA